MGLAAIFTVVGLATLFTGKLGAEWVGLLLGLVAVLMGGPVLVSVVGRTFTRALAVVFAQEGRIAAGNVERQRQRSATTAAVMMVGLAIVVLLAGVTVSVTNSFTMQIDRQIPADFMIAPPAAMVGQGAVAVSSTLAEQLAAVPGVEAVSSFRRHPTRAEGFPLSLVGIDPATFPKVGRLALEPGEDHDAVMRALEAPDAIVVNALWSRQAKKAVGDTVTFDGLAGPVTYRVVAIGGDIMNIRSPAAVVSQRTLARDFGVRGDSILFAKAGKGADLEAIRSAFKPIVAEFSGLTLQSTREWKAALMADGEKKLSAMYVLLLVIVLPALVALANTLGINVLERIRELGLLRAVGSTRRQVRRIVLAESLVLASTGALAGLALGLWSGVVSVHAMELVGMKSEFLFPVGGAVFAFGTAIVFGLLAAAAPARHAAGLSIVAALRHE